MKVRESPSRVKPLAAKPLKDGRKTLCYDIELGQAIATLIRTGVPAKLALRKVCGIARPTHARRLLKLYRDGETEGLNEDQIAFCAEVVTAELEFVETATKNIKMHSANDWKASSWLLSKVSPDEFGDKQRLDITNVSQLSDEALRGQLVEACLSLPDDSPDKLRLYTELHSIYGSKLIEIEADNV